jgi:DNA repair protein RecO (recombination protein O)
MRQVIQGIYLGHINYSESSVIGRFYTRQFGKRSFIIKGAKSKKSKIAPLLQSLNEVEITSNFQEEKNLNLSFGVHMDFHHTSLATDIRKGTIAMFMAEILNKSIIEEEPNPMLYGFVQGSIRKLEQQEFSPHFHLLFLIEYSLFLGFYPRTSPVKSNEYFNLSDGIFEHENYKSPFHLSAIASTHLSGILSYGETYFDDSQVSKLDRIELLNGLVRYFEIQLGLKSGSFKSHSVLQTIFA